MERDPLLIRPLGTFETGMDILERRGAGHMVRVIECDGVVDADRARLAVRAVVSRTPTLRTRFVRPTGEAAFFAFHDLDAPVTIVERHGPDDWMRELHGELNRRFDPDGALVRARIVTSGDAGGEIIVSCHHAVADGRSLQTLCHELVDEYERRCRDADGGATHEVHAPPGGSISPALDTLLPDWMSGERLQEMLDAFMEARASFFGGAPPATFANERGDNTEPSRTHVLHRQLPEATVTRIHDAAHDRGTTVNGALCAALLGGAAASGTVDVEQTFVLTSSIDLRPYLSRSVPLTDMGAYPGGTQATCVGVRKTEMWDLAHDITDQLHVGMERHEHLLSVLAQAEVNKVLESNGYEGGGFGGLCVVSNLGRLDPPTEAANLRPRAIHGGLPAHAFGTAYIYCFAVGHAGSLLVNLFYPHPEMSHATAEGVCEYMMNALTTAAR